MPNSAIELITLADQSPVVATHMGIFDAISVEDTMARYARTAATYVRPFEIATFQRKLIEKIISCQTAIGCLVAPFGYGKTSTAIDMWEAANAQNILAVPPFSCTSIAEMGQAIATAVILRLGSDTVAGQEVQSAYERYLVSSAKRLAEQDSVRYQIDFAAALRSIEDKIERGLLNLEATGNYLLVFLEELTQIVQREGYRGLLVIVDEFQQFLGNINKAVVTSFRTLVWGLRTRGAVPFGLLITMDPDTERNLSDRAGDILHRIKEDGLYLDFSDVYDRHFAPTLWNRYAQQFRLESVIPPMVDAATLNAIGQICERHDLSNGPRTVIDLLQRITTVYPQRERSYSPIDLIDDFLNGNIRFDGNRSIIAALVTELISYDYIKRSPERLRTLKLIAAFPRGCARNVSANYDLDTCYDEMCDALRGEILTELPEGIALIDLQRLGKPQNKLNIILKKYWMQITEGELIADRSLLLFARYVITPLFSPFRNVLSGWTSKDPDFVLTASGSYCQTYEGTYTEAYPQRTIAVQICRSTEQIAPLSDSADLTFIFVLQRGQEIPLLPRYDTQSHTFYLRIELDLPFTMPLPRDVRWIEDFLRPIQMSPGVLLSLLDYITTQASTLEGVTEQEMQRIEAHRQKLNSFLLAVLFGNELFAPADITVLARGEQAVRDVLFQILRTLYPNYQTLIVSSQWELLARSYRHVLQDLLPIYARGIEPLRERKVDLAARFGMRNHAGFESHAKQFGLLLNIEAWSGDEGSIKFHRHPGEDILLNEITDRHTLDLASLIRIGRFHGYLEVETMYLLDFLRLRGHIQYEDATECYKAVDSLEVPELQELGHSILNTINHLSKYGSFPTLDKAKTQIEDVLSCINTGDLTSIHIRLLQIRHIVQDAQGQVARHLYECLVQMRAAIYEHRAKLQAALPMPQTGLELDTHIGGAQRNLTGRSQTTSVSAQKLVSQLSELLKLLGEREDNILTDAVSVGYHKLSASYVDWIKQTDQIFSMRGKYNEWVHLVERLGRVVDYISMMKENVNVTALEREASDVKSGMMEGLAVGGLSAFDSLYNAYAPRVEKLDADMRTAIKVAELTQIPTHLMNLISARNTSDIEARVLHMIDGNSLTLGEVIERCNIAPTALMELLAKLDQQGEIVVTIQSRRELK